MPCIVAHLHTPIMKCVHMGGLTTFSLSWLWKRGKNNEIKPNHISLITIYEYNVIEWRCMKSNKCMDYTWSNNMCETCIWSLEKEMIEGVPQNHLKSFKIGTLVHLCTFSAYALYTLCTCLVQWHNFNIATIERVHMGGLTIFQCHAWLKMRKIKPELS